MGRSRKAAKTRCSREMPKTRCSKEVLETAKEALDMGHSREVCKGLETTSKVDRA